MKLIGTPAKLRSLRATNNWTQAQLALLAGLREQTIAGMENGRVKITAAMARLFTYIDRYGALE